MLASMLSRVLCLTLLTLLVGCKGESADVTNHRAKLLLNSEPADALGVIDIREDRQLPADVVVLGQVGGVEQPWTDGQAAFMIVDPSLAMEHHEGEQGGHDPKTCPFCKKRLAETTADSLAVIRFTDDKGQVLPIDARKLFGLSEHQMVVVRGRAEVDKSGHLVVSANGLYIRK